MLREGVAHAFAKNAKVRLTHLPMVPVQHQLETVPKQKENRALDPDTGRLPLTTLSCEDT